MPYVLRLPAHSPYIPKGIRAIDPIPKALHEPIQIGGEWMVSVINSGIPMDPDMVPRRYAVDLRPEALPEFFGMLIGYGVSDRFREKVEELEPDVHQFFPVELTAKDGLRPEKRYWFLHICNRVDAIDPEETTLPLGPGNRQYKVTSYTVGQPINMVIKREVVAGKCMWMDRRLMDFFFSDELYEFAQENKITKFDGWKVEAK